MFTKLVERLSDRLSPTATAAVMFPVYLVLSLPLAYITGTFTVIILENIATGVTSGGGQSAYYGWIVGVVIAVLYAVWSSYGSYHLSKEIDEEPGKDAVSA